MRKKEDFVKDILRWYKRNKRDFNWRKTRDPYKILVAEIMLQKTDAKKVSEIYDGFIAKYPNIEALSKASVEELRKEIMLLGIHSRAERLKNLAIKIITKHDGLIPSNKKKLMELPGVGSYIANAVLCFAFDRDVPLIDANIIRVLNRVFSITSSKSRPRNDMKMWDTVEKLVPKGRGREFNFGLLDFAAKVCTVKNPKHEVCPIKNICDHYKTLS